MKRKKIQSNIFHIFKKNNSSFICFGEGKYNLKKFENLKKIDLKKDENINKIEIFIDGKKLLTNNKNVFAVQNMDLAFLVKLELLRNSKEMNILKMPLTLFMNNLIDFINPKEGLGVKTKNMNTIQTEHNNNYQINNLEKEEKNSTHTHVNNMGKDLDNCRNDTGEFLSSFSNCNIKERTHFDIQRALIEKNIYDHFKTDLIFYRSDEINSFGTEKKKYMDLENSINLPNSVNYLENYKIKNLREEENNIYNKFMNMFEDIHKIKLNSAKNFETPEQDEHVHKTIQNLIKNMNNSEIFIFYKCTQILNSFIFSYLFLKGYINYKDVYRYCNLEYIYQFSKWGYVYDINSIKDSSSLLTLSSLMLIMRAINTETENHINKLGDS
ncbi:ATP synthase mitochondrial F1 complex assembly factor 2, putative [Plasmodium vinckei lentum]|uniref:ATP synthase mitochondrial F1 complex assembly factor 2, putative n=1 Tax=Plasmodium vinckei lentum TaxID=138297 RepID=A0A6V7RWW1_PLAVN|nr:ATP synthase mitochondrial F1 complex assembly factor 2, putative [Plasmodium vinckei lentum]